MEVVQLLYTEKVISKEIYNKALKPEGLQPSDLLTALHVTVCENPNTLKVFASILLRSKRTVTIGNDILADFSKYGI